MRKPGWRVSTFCYFLILTAPALAQPSGASPNPKAAQAVEAVRTLCLSGSQYDLKVDAGGNLSLSKLNSGENGSVSVNVRESQGAAAIFDEKLRRFADADVRTCMQPYIGRIVDAILAGGPVSPNSDEISYQWGSSPSSDQYPLGPGGCECAAPLRGSGYIRITNGCNGDIAITAVRNAVPDPSITMPSKPNYPWALIPGGRRQFANVTLAASKSISFDGAYQVFFWYCPNQ